jgi:hypothetical protein
MTLLTEPAIVFLHNPSAPAPVFGTHQGPQPSAVSELVRIRCAFSKPPYAFAAVTAPGLITCPHNMGAVALIWGWSAPFEYVLYLF